MTPERMKQALSGVRNGALLVFPGSGAYGRLVRWWTCSRFAHVGLLVTVDGEPLVLEAQPGLGVRVIPAWMVPPSAVVEVPGMEWGRVSTFAWGTLSMPYNWLDALRAGFGLPPRNHGYECAQLVAEVLAHGCQREVPESIPRTPQAVVDLALMWGGRLVELPA